MKRYWMDKLFYKIEGACCRLGLLSADYSLRRDIFAMEELSYEDMREHWEEKTSTHGDISPEAMKKIADHTMNTMGLSKEDGLLSVGCGDGKIDYYLKNRVAKMCGYDFSEQKIDAAKKLNPTVSYWKQSFLERMPCPPAGINKVYSFSVVQYCRQEDLHFFLELQVDFLRNQGGGVIGHLDVPDVDKAHLYWPYAKEVVAKRRNLLRMMSPDGSRWHNMDDFQMIARRLGADIKIKDAMAEYRSDILIYVH